MYIRYVYKYVFTLHSNTFSFLACAIGNSEFNFTFANIAPLILQMNFQKEFFSSLFLMLQAGQNSLPILYIWIAFDPIHIYSLYKNAYVEN